MQHLIGMNLPDVELRTSARRNFNPASHRTKAIYFCYPYTGRAGVADPQEWDTIKGAHGSTPQALKFAELHEAFRKMNVDVFGLSFLSEDWIADFSALHKLPYDLLSDAEGNFSTALNLPRFKAGDREFLQRLTLLCDQGRITSVLYPVETPAENASDVLRRLQTP